VVKEFVYQVIQDIFEEKELVILEMNGEADHMCHLFSLTFPLLKMIYFLNFHKN
jgi:REP element-mobilizing transposase RayT